MLKLGICLYLAGVIVHCFELETSLRLSAFERGLVTVLMVSGALLTLASPFVWLALGHLPF